MIELNLIGGRKIIVNAELIKWIEALPRTTSITLTTDDKLIAENSVDEIIEKIIKYKRSIHSKELEDINIKK